MRIKLAIAIANAKGSAVDLSAPALVPALSVGLVGSHSSPCQEFQKNEEESEPRAKHVPVPAGAKKDVRLVISLRKKISELEAWPPGPSRLGAQPIRFPSQDALRQARALQEAAEARCRELEAAAAEAGERGRKGLRKGPRPRAVRSAVEALLLCLRRPSAWRPWRSLWNSCGRRPGSNREAGVGASRWRPSARALPLCSGEGCLQELSCRQRQ